MKSLFILLMICFNVWTASASQWKFPEPVVKNHNHINITVLPQVELISIVQTIGNYPAVLGFLMSKDSSEYKADVVEYFSEFKNHPAVLMFDRLSSRPAKLNFSAPSNVMLYTDNHLNLREDIIRDEFVLNRADGTDSLNLLLNYLKDFAMVSSFNDFYIKHTGYYNQIIDNTIANLGKKDFISELEHFYGTSQKNYSIVLVSLYNFVGFGNSLLFDDGKREIYNTMGPQKVVQGISYFGDEEYLQYMIRHEFSHPYVNPLTEKHWELVSDYSARYDSIPENSRKSMCGDWQECINEFVIRSVTTKLAMNSSEETGAAVYLKEKNRGVSLLDELLESIKVYESNRNRYPDLESYYPELLKVFIQ